MVHSSDNPVPGEAGKEGRNPAAYRRGLLIALVGLGGFAPALLVAVLSDEWRAWAAVSTLGFWIIWKIGRTIMKVNSGLA
jgi:hypothetical protein